MPNSRSIIAGLWSVVCLLVIASSSICAEKPILDINLTNEADRIVISASSNTPFNVGVFKSSANRYLGFEFKGVLMHSGKYVGIRSGKIVGVKYSSFQNNPPVSRVVVNTTAMPDYDIIPSADKKQATIVVAKNANAKLTIEDKSKPAQEAAPAVKNENAAQAKAPVAKQVKAEEPKPAPVVKEVAKKDPPALQVAAKPKAAVKPALVKAAQPKPVQQITPAPEKGTGNISLNFSNADVVDVLKALAQQSKQDIVVSKAVGGKVTLNLTSVTPEQALNYVSKISGFHYVKQGKTYLVGTKSSLLGLATNEDLDIRVEAIMLSYASPNDVISILQTRFPDLKIRKSDTRWRVLPIKGSDDISTVERLTESTRIVGQAQAQKELSQDSGTSADGAKAVETGKSASVDTNVDQSGVESESVTVSDQMRGRQEQTKDDSSMIIISGAAKIVAEAKNLVAQMETAVYATSLESTFEIYRVKFVRADTLSKALTQLVPGVSISRAPQGGMDGFAPPSALDDPVQAGDKAIIISGRHKDIERAMEVIGRLDVSVEPGDGLAAEAGLSNKFVVELVSVKNVSGDDVIKAIAQHMPGIKANLIGTNKEIQKPEDKAQLLIGSQPQATGSVIILSGPQILVNNAKNLVAQMDSALHGALYTADGDAENQVVLEKYEVKYVNPVELANSLKNLVPAVTVTFAPSEGFDLEGPGAIMISETGGSSVQNIAKAQQEAPEEGKQLVPQNVKSLLLLGSESSVKYATDLAAKLDVKSPQIKIDAKVTSITESGGKKLGLSWDWDALRYNEMEDRATWLRDPVGFGATLEALYSSGDIQILANPSLTILEGKPGVFFVGDEVTYITRVETTPTGQNVQTESKLVGIQLKVNGKISSDGNITLNLHPEVSTLKLSSDGVANVTLPTVSRRFTDQIVRVKNGETYVVGGLIRNDETSDMTKIPLLGDLPFFGNIFRHSAKSKQRTEVVMFITASIVDD